MKWKRRRPALRRSGSGGGMYLGVDIGTSSVKVVLMDETQRILGTHSEPLKLDRPQPGWSEQDPESWVAGTSAGIEAIATQFPDQMGAVRGIGLSGQMHGATVLDKSDRPLRPCILWNDGRAADEAAELDADPRFRTLTGNIVFPGFTAPKIVWMERHEPKCFNRIAKVLLPKDYVRLWLSGDHASDMSDSSGTSWLDVGARAWSDELLTATGMSRDRMPKLFEGTAPTGRLRDILAARWKMREPVVIAGGAGDNAASACGVGTVAPGSAFVSLGTSGVIFVANERFSPNAASAVHAFCHALPDTWHQMGVILSAAASLEWLAGLLGKNPAELVALAEAEDASAGEVMFLPYLSGERTPHNDASARGSFVGLSHVTNPASLGRAVMEGVAFAFADSLAALKSAGAHVERATAVGGGSRSSAWLQIIADALNVPIDLPADGDFGAAFGAARLGLIAAEGADPLAVCTPPVISKTFQPNPVGAARLGRALNRYRALHPAIKDTIIP